MLRLLTSLLGIKSTTKFACGPSALARSAPLLDDGELLGPVRGNDEIGNIFGSYRPRSSGDGIGAAISPFHGRSWHS